MYALSEMILLHGRLAHFERVTVQTSLPMEAAPLPATSPVAATPPPVQTQLPTTSPIAGDAPGSIGYIQHLKLSDIASRTPTGTLASWLQANLSPEQQQRILAELGAH